MHIDRHLGKTDEELIIRLMNDWKLYSSCMNIPLEKSFNKDGVYIIHTDSIIGYGYNRKYEKIISDAYKVIVKDKEAITIYPDLEHGIHTGVYFDFSLINYNNSLWDLFTDAVYSLDAEVRYINKDKPQLRIYFDRFILKINRKFDAIIVEDINGHIKGHIVEGKFKSTDDIRKYINTLKSVGI